jgi:integrase
LWSSFISDSPKEEERYILKRENWLFVQEYLRYRLEIDMVAESTHRLEENWLRYLLEWVGEKEFKKVLTIKPAFPRYILENRIDGKNKQLSLEYVKKILRTTKNFFKWLMIYKSGYKKDIPIWITTLKAPRMTVETGEHEHVTFDEIVAIAKAPVRKLSERRIQAAVVFLWLSGMRIGAFVSLPVVAVDLQRLSVRQWPKLGVRTKFSKHATTFLYNIPELLQVVKEWDEEIRKAAPEGLWFAHISPETGEIDPMNTTASKGRNSGARKDMVSWLKEVNLPYHSFHKFRHGHAVFGLKQVKTIQEYKAISQNLMHSNITITDKVYGGLSTLDVGETITSIGRVENGAELDISERLAAIEKLIYGASNT